jgi:quercetin dioxygenase-like cupin family protein
VALRVYDFHDNIRNFVITPEIRMRFYQMAVGQVDSRHSHDLGHEIFFILQGKCEMEVEGERAVLGPGQACVALRDQLHQAKNVGDTPVIMYLSVSPHVVPTHTSWTTDPKEGGTKRPARYAMTYAPPSLSPPPRPVEGLSDRYFAAARALFDASASAARLHETAGPELNRALLVKDSTDARQQIDVLWSSLLPLLRAVSDLESAWNQFAPRAAPDDNVRG